MHHNNQNLQFTEALHVLPKLEYCAAVWDPTNLHSPSNWRTPNLLHAKSSPKNGILAILSLLNKLQFKSLKDRRIIQKLKVCYKIIINNKSCIPPTVFSPHPSPSPRHPHNQILFIPHVGTSSHKHSFFLDVIPKWNSLPLEVVNLCHLLNRTSVVFLFNNYNYLISRSLFVIIILFLSRGSLHTSHLSYLTYTLLHTINWLCIKIS